MKNIIPISLFIILCVLACNETTNNENNENNENTESDNSSQIDASPPSSSYEVPSDYELLKEAIGDLDKDGKEEKVIVYNTSRETDMGTEREIHILKKNKGQWELWHKSIGAVLPSQHGGMMGDPFEAISIVRGCIMIEHFGGSRQKWAYTHRYRNQNNDWELIGATIVYGAPCDYWEELDYNLSNGKAVYEKEVEDCDKETSKIDTKEFTMKDDELPKMDAYYPGNNALKVPDRDVRIYY